MADKKPSPKSKVEAILFSVGHRISIDEISKLARVLKQDALAALKELQKEYDEKQSSLMLVEDGDHWKFAVRDHLISVVRKIVTETELTRSVMETLAVIAFKYPILQSDLIKLRTNKAYDHLVELEKSGYITRQKHGRTNLIKLTEKFFRYFDLTEESLREKFKDFSSIAQAIKEKETEVEKIKEDQKNMAIELGKQDEKIKEEIESLDEAGEDYNIPLETYGTYDAKAQDNTTAEPGVTEQKAEPTVKVDDLEADLDVVAIENKAEKKEKGYKGHTVAKEEAQPKDQQTQSNVQPTQPEKDHNEIPQKERGKKHGIHLSPEQEKIAQQKADDMVRGK